MAGNTRYFTRLIQRAIELLLLFIFVLSPGVALAQVTADFTSSDTAGCGAMTVNFTNTSTGATSYSWNLGNGTITSITNASASYTSAGSYTVTLTAYNGATSSTHTVIVTAYSIPTVDFFASNTNVCPGAPVTFTSTSVSNAWGPLTYTWNFGDGSSSTANSPVYSYMPPGYYNITLYATSKPGCVGSLSKGTYMHVITAPAVSFHAASTHLCTPPVSASFINTTTGSGTLSFNWFFGDGGTSTGTFPSYTYTTAGTYTVKLVATDITGCYDSLTQFAYITAGALKAGFFAAPLTCLNLPTTFTDTSTAHKSGKWYFGDGSTSSADTTTHTYTTTGTFTVKRVVFDGTCYDSTTHAIIVVTPSGTVTISQLCTPLSTLTYSCATAPGNTINWLYGDGASGTGALVTHSYIPFAALFPPLPALTVYSSPPYNIQTVLTDGNGCIDTISRQDTMSNLWAYLSASVFGGCIPLTTTFSVDAAATLMIGNNPLDPYVTVPYLSPIASYLWDFADGTPSSSAAAPTHIYTAAGKYNVKCHIVTANGCSADNYIQIQAGIRQTGSFKRSPTRVCAGQPITFVSTSTSSALIDNITWDFGSGYNGSLVDSIVYITHEPGIYNAGVTVYNNLCPSAPFYLADTVDSPGAIINYRYTCIPDNGIAFADSSVGAHTYSWDFGDGTTSTVLNPVHYYPSLSKYTAKLYIYGASTGCRDTASQDIFLQRLSAKLTPVRDTICRDVMDTIVDRITPVGNIATFATSASWYVNGVLSKTDTPLFLLLPPPSIDMGDTLFPVIHPAGVNNVTLILTDNHGCLDTFSKNLSAVKPTDKFSISSAVGCVPANVGFTDLSTDIPGAFITNYFWDFGDGNAVASSTSSVVYTYTAAGTYIIQEVVTDNIGCSDTMINTSHAVIHKPTANFFSSDSVICLGSNISFINRSSSNCAGWLWLYGDGSSSTAIAGAHIYSAPGIYTVTLVAIDSAGCTDTIIKPGYATVNPLPAASFYMSDSFAVCPPLNVNFINTTTGATAFAWSFGDGAFSVLPSPNDIYVVPGLYRIKLVASNIFGCIDSAIGHASTFGYTGAFTYSPLSACTSSPVHFKASISGVASIIWDFNDGVLSSLSTTDTISHSYTAQGFYIPKLILTDSSGCSSFSLGADTIKVDTMIPGFKFFPDPGCQNSSVTFQDTSFSYLSPATAWLWSFGPGAVSTVNSPNYTYTVSGTHVATLTVTNRSGCTSTVSENFLVNPAPAAISGIPAACVGQTAVLSDATGTGAWSSSNTVVATMVAGVLTGLIQGTSTISYTLATGCNVIVTATVHPLPSAISGPLNVCVAATATLSDGAAGGTWSSSNTALATIGTGSGIVSGIAPGTLNITYTSGAGCIATEVFSVSPLPVGITGVTEFCKGATTSLSDASGGGAWSSGNTAMATVASGTVTGIAAGTAAITYMLGTGCIAANTVTIDPTPQSIVGVINVCPGVIAILSDKTPGGTWSSSNTSIITISTGGIATGNTAGTSTITYTLVTGCVATQKLTVNALPQPINGTTEICAGATSALSSATFGGKWASSNTTIAAIGSGTGLVAGIAAGSATISYTSGFGCTTTQGVTVNPLPPYIKGPTSLCLGMAISLSDSITGGVWSSAASTVAVGSTSALVTGMLAGTATVTYSLSTGCSVNETITVQSLPVAIAGLVPICKGTSVTLSDASPGGTWGTGATTVNVDVATGKTTGIAAGTAAVTYTNMAGCIVAATVTIQPLPAPVSGVANVCSGLTTIWSDADVGGTWSSGNTAFATVSALGIVTGMSPGTAAITYTLATGCSIDTVVIINKQPSAITGKTIICAGAATTLSDNIPAGMWSSSNTAVADTAGTTGIIRGIAAGTATISYTLTNGCFTTVTLTVDSLPLPITGTLQLCKGDTGTLSDAGGGTWTSGNTSVVTVGAGSGIVAGILPGTTSITYTLSTGCDITRQLTVNPLPLAIIGTPQVCVGDQLSLSDADAGGTWSDAPSGIAAINTTTGILTGVIPGTAVVTYTLATGCITTKKVTINTLPAAISGSNYVCIGEPTTFIDTTNAGIWSSADTIVSINASTGVAIGLAPGTAVISYTLITECRATLPVTITTLPGPVTGNKDICYALFTTLLDTPSGGVWSSPDTLVSVNAVTGTVNGLALGAATITYTLLTGCYVTTTATVDPVPPAIKGTTYVCKGQVTALSDSLATGSGTWVSSLLSVASVDPSGNVTGVSGGTATITYTTGGGCTTMTTVTVYPLIPRITGKSSVCTYDTIILSNTAFDGIWSSSNTVVARVNTTGLVTGLSAGSTIISYTALNNCDTARQIVVVNPLPDAGTINGNPKLCTGATQLFNDTASGGTWIAGNTTVATVSGTGLATGIAAGTGTITYVYTNICGTAKTYVAVTVNETPAMAHIVTHPDSVLCNNTLFQNFGADVAAPQGIQYVWYSDHGDIYAISQDGQYCLVSFRSPGKDIVTLSSTLPGTNCSSTDALVFDINPSESPLPGVVYYDPEFICKDNTAQSYQWGYDDKVTLDSTLLTGMVNENYYNPVPSFSKYYYWVITNHNGCLQKSYYNAPPAAVGTMTKDGLELLLFPNPAGSVINLEVKGISNGGAIDATLYDVVGKKHEVIRLKDGKGSFGLSGLPPGVYMVSFDNNGTRIGARTFVKE